MKYILYQNTSYKRTFVSNVVNIEEWNQNAIFKESHIKPILVTTDKSLLKLVRQSLKEKYTK